MLVGSMVLPREALTPQARVDLRDDGYAFRDIPAVEWPEVDSVAQLMAEVAKPGKASMCRFRYRSWNIEVEHGLGGSRANLCQAPPTRITGASFATTVIAVPDKIDIDVVAVSRPVPLEIVKECRPVKRQLAFFEIGQREGQPVIGSDFGRLVC